MNIDINRKERYVTLSMAGYSDKLLQEVRPEGIKSAKTPAIYFPPNYKRPGAQTATIDDSPAATDKQKKELQSVIGTLLYYYVLRLALGRSGEPRQPVALQEWLLACLQGSAGRVGSWVAHQRVWHSAGCMLHPLSTAQVSAALSRSDGCSRGSEGSRRASRRSRRRGSRGGASRYHMRPAAEVLACFCSAIP